MAKVQLITMNEFAQPFYLKFRATGDSSACGTLVITSQYAHTATITGGLFYTDAAGATSAGAIKAMVVGANTMYFKCNEPSCVIYTIGITQINGYTSPVNSPTGGFSTANIPDSLTYLDYVSGVNVATGDVAGLPLRMTFLRIAGANAFSGDVSNLPAGLTYMVLAGSNTCSGDIANLPAGLTYIDLGGSNACSGDVANLPFGATFLNFAGSNTCSGDIANLPAGLTFLGLVGANTATFVGTRIWAANMDYVYLRPTIGSMTSEMVDNLFISLSAQSAWVSNMAIDLRGYCGAVTAASAAARATLAGYGVTCLFNS